MPGDDDNKNKSGHTFADHTLGYDPLHVHDGDADHDHDDFDPGALEDNPIWIADHVTLTSVGIDTGMVKRWQGGPVEE
jgi:ethanolamine utilization protein EutA